MGFPLYTGRRQVCVPLVAAALVAAASLAAAPAHAEEPAAVAPIDLKIASIAPQATPWAKLVDRIKKTFMTELPGRFRVKIYLGGSLGGEKELVNRCMAGGLSMIGVTTGALATVVPELDVLELPYLWKDERQVDRALAGALGNELKKAMEAKGFVLYVWSENGFRHFATRDRFVQKPDDLKGLRMRAQESYIHTSMYKQFGAAANAMPAPEVPGALSSGVIDGYDNSLLYAFATQWHRSIKFLTLSKHIYQPAVIVFCKAVWDAMPEDMRAAVAKQAPKIEAAGRAMVRQGNIAALANHRETGVLVAEQKNPGLFKAKAQAVWLEFAQRTPGGAAWLALAKAAAK